MARAFDGIRVIDFTQVLAGPFATQQLAQLGADVIKIEQPGTGDQTRGLMPGSDDAGMSPSFLTCNIGKRSLTLNLKAPQARAIVHALVRSADVVVENFTPGVMQRLGFDYASLAALKPDLLYCSISGYGQSGPKSSYPAFDGAIQAASGMMAINGHPETGPTRTGYMPVDMATALNTAFAIAAALYRRSVSGQGQRLDVAMMDTAMVMQAPQVSGFLVNGVQPELFGNRSPTRAPTANVFATADGLIQVVALKELQVQKLFEVLGCLDRYQDARFSSNDARIANTPAVNELLTSLFARATTQMWLERLIGAGVPVAEIRDFAAVTADPQFENRSALVEIDSPMKPGRRVRVVGSGYVAIPDGPAPLRPPPKLGEHTDEILAELGYPQSDIAALRAASVI
ncbi:MAG TPA: CoA transferase [Pseudomonadales bacterium]|nr:CoA transferase [Pseudomonadales bacterium]